MVALFYIIWLAEYEVTFQNMHMSISLFCSIFLESALNLPYHMPESKTIHDFFKRKPRPTCQGSAMALLK